MGQVLGLQRIAKEGDGEPKHPGALRDLHKTAQAVLNEAGLEDDTIFAADGLSFSVTVPDGTAEIYDSHAVFPVNHLDPLTLKMMFEIAKTGDMAIVGDGIAILTDPGQPHPYWLDKTTAVPLCHSTDELVHLLAGWFGEFNQFRKAALRDVRTEKDSLPGTQDTPTVASFYVEIKAGETNSSLFDRIGRFLRILMREGDLRPKDGVMQNTAWQLETPDGRVYVPLRLRGNHNQRKELIREFASRERRLTGEIVNAETFSSSQGSSFPLSGCKYAKRTD